VFVRTLSRLKNFNLAFSYTTLKILMQKSFFASMSRTASTFILFGEIDTGETEIDNLAPGVIS